LLKKDIKTYKQGNREVQKININKKDDLNGTVYILTPTEYKTLENKIKKLEYELNQDKKEKNLMKESIKNQKYYEKLIDKQEESIKKLDQQHHEQLKEIDQQHINQLKESYEQFNKDMTKYITINQLQNTALQQILELGFIDIIRNKHKSIAKDQIKELTNDKKIYELIEKK